MTSLLQLKCRNCAWKLITSHLCQQLTASRHMEARRRTSGRGQTGLISSGRKHQVQSYILLPWRIHHPVPTRLCDTILIVCSWKYDKSIDIALRCRYNKRSTCAKKYWHFSFPWWSIFSGLLPPRERERGLYQCVWCSFTVTESLTLTSHSFFSVCLDHLSGTFSTLSFTYLNHNLVVNFILKREVNKFYTKFCGLWETISASTGVPICTLWLLKGTLNIYLV